MNKKPILSKHPKKFIVFLLVCLITITLAGCDSSNKAPTDDIDLNATYASVGDYKVTVGDVYNKLRYNAVEYLERQVYNYIYQEEIKTLTDDLYNEDKTVNKESKYFEKIENKILSDIYGVYEEDEIEELSDKEQRIAVKEYKDNMYKKGYAISEDDIKNKKFESVYPFYYLEIAKYIAAEKKLSEEFTRDAEGKLVFNYTDNKYWAEVESLLDDAVTASKVNEYMAKLRVEKGLIIYDEKLEKSYTSTYVSEYENTKKLIKKLLLN